MKIKSIRKYTSNKRVFLTADIESVSLEGTKQVFFSYPEEFHPYVPENADPFLAAVLIPCMISREDIEVFPPLSKKLMESQPVIQDIFTVWFPGKLTMVNVTAHQLTEEKNERENRGNASFFSLGVDSMYSMLKHLPENHPHKGEELSSLIYMKGLELPLSVYSGGQDIAVIDRVKQVAQHYNLELIYGETNIRDIFPINWEDYYFGPGLAAVALSLSGGFKNIYIPSSYSYAYMFAVPSSPLTDPLWSNEDTRIIHDGAEKERAEKIADLITRDSFALNNLRVCVDNEGGDYNCGKCWKCLRTMVTLDIVDKLKDAGSFPHTLPEGYALKFKAYHYDSMIYAVENLKLAKKYGKIKTAKLIDREIRLGKLDQFCEGKSKWYIITEIIYYFFYKLLRKIKGIKY